MKLQKILKKATVAVCSIAMAMSVLAGSGIAAYAEETAAKPTIDTEEKGSLTINKYLGAATDKTTPLKGVEFTYVKVADINQVKDNTGNKGNSSLNYTLPKDVYNTLFTPNLGENANVPAKTSDEINTALSGKLDATTNTATKNALEDYVTGATGKVSVTTELTTTDPKVATATADNLPVGLYLVVETQVPENVYSTTDPFFVSIPMTVTDQKGNSSWNYDITVEPKNQNSNPTIDKKVKDDKDSDYADTTSVSMGDTVSYQITSQLPAITSKSTYLTDYTFVDTLAKGLSYVKDSSTAQNVTITFNDGTDGTVATKWKTDTDVDDTKDDIQAPFTVTYGTDKNTMTIAFTDAGLAAINPTMSGKTMTITYTATVDNTAEDHAVMGDTGNDNDVQLTFKRTNTTESETLEDKSVVYTYGLDLTKVLSNKGNDDSYTNVKFKLSSTTHTAAVKVKGSNGVYYVSSANDAVEEFSADADGKLKIYGLEADTYSLTETATASGYSLLKEPITITITSSSKAITPASLGDYAAKTAISVAETTTPATATVDNNTVTMTPDTRGTEVATDDSANALVPLTITNTKSFTLPTTGGLGALICTMFGAIVFAGAFIFLRKRA